MNFKFSQKDATDSAITGVSAIAGATASKGVMGIVPEGAKKPLVRAGISLATLLLASSIQGKDTLAKASQGALLGVSVEQGIGAVSKLVSPSVKETPTTQGEKFVAAIAGMNAPEENMFQSALNVASYDWSPKNDLGDFQPEQNAQISLGEFKG